MKIAVLKELAEGERRVAATPETIKKFAALGAEMAVESGAGTAASYADADYEAAGAKLGTRAATLKGADIILGVQGPDPAGLKGMAAGAWLVAGLNPFGERARVDAYAKLGVEALAMEFMPRITRAQSMDILSSQSNLAGYKSVLDAAAEYGRAFPMMMTAAGTVSAARVFVMGVGVAGLQAIATARRLGAQVSATDVRSATKEQIQSLGAKPIFVENVAGIEGEGSGGYAGEMSPEYLGAYRQAGHRHHHRADPGAPGAAADLGGAGRQHEAGQRDRRSRGRGGRQCRGRCRRRSCHRQWREDRRPPQRRGPSRGGRLGAVLAQPV